MSISVSITCALLLISAATVQLVIAALFRKRFISVCREEQSKKQTAEGKPSSPAVILMSLRGNDPSLRDSLEGALSQEYGGQYQVRVVVDHATDPAVPLLAELQENHANGNRLSYSVMESPAKTCSLKCHSLSQSVSELPAEIEYVALLDADVRPHSTWLTELARPLTNDETIGGVTGTQWFEPSTGAGVGAWLRSVWNGGATILTIHFANPWAGSFAMRHADLVASGLIERWQKSMVDDGPIRAAMKSIDKRICFAPSIVMVNGERCTLRYTLNWAARMLTWSRLYEPTFWITILHALFSNFVMLVNFSVLATGLFGWLPPVTIWISLAALIVAGTECAVAFCLSRSCVGESLKLRSEELTRLGGRHWLWAFVCAAPAHLMFGWGCMIALMTKRITWRGIEYRLGTGGEAERLNYQPFASVSNTESDHSI